MPAPRKRRCAGARDLRGSRRGPYDRSVRTEVLRVDPQKGPWPELARIARLVDDGGLVAFPTETVYGIAVNLRDEAAMRRLYQVKGRASAKPLTVHLSSPDALEPSVRDLPRTARKLVARFWPG